MSFKVLVVAKPDPRVAGTANAGTATCSWFPGRSCAITVTYVVQILDNDINRRHFDIVAIATSVVL